MWCTTECWNCEDKTCEHYISKQDIYFKYKQSQSNWNSLREWVQKHYDEYKDMEQEAMFEFGLMLDKMNELEGGSR